MVQVRGTRRNQMKWFEHEKDEVRGYRLKEPYQNVMVGCDPKDGMTKASADSFDVYVNVSDSECNTFEPSRDGQFMHWYPVNECGRWNLSYLFWLKKVMDHHHAAGRRIYLHCHAGAYRSPSAAILWLQSRGHSAEEALTIGKESGSTIYRLWKSFDNIPKLKDEVFKLMNEHPTWSLGGILHHTKDYWNHEVMSGSGRRNALLHRYLWFYYEPKWWLRDKFRKFKDWAFRRYGWFSEGYGTYMYRRKYFWAWPTHAEPEDPSDRISVSHQWDPETRKFEKKERKV
jgi:hypothetical protein